MKVDFSVYAYEKMDYQKFKNMVVKYNKEKDVIYIQLSDAKVFESDQEKSGIILDYNEAENIIGIDVLHASQKANQPNGIIYEVA